MTITKLQPASKVETISQSKISLARLVESTAQLKQANDRLEQSLKGLREDKLNDLRPGA